MLSSENSSTYIQRTSFLDVRRASVGYGKRQQLDLAGLIVTVLRGKGQ